MERRRYVYNQGSDYRGNYSRKTREEAIKNLEEAVNLYLEEMPEIIEELKLTKPIGIVDIEIT